MTDHQADRCAGHLFDMGQKKKQKKRTRTKIAFITQIVNAVTIYWYEKGNFPLVLFFLTKCVSMLFSLRLMKKKQKQKEPIKEINNNTKLIL